MDNGHPKIEYQMNMRLATFLLGIVLALSTPWGCPIRFTSDLSGQCLGQYAFA